MARRTAISTARAIFTRSARAPPTSRCMKSSCGRTTVSIRCPYMARQADGARLGCRRRAGDRARATRAGSRSSRTASRPVEEIDRLGIGEHGTGNLISAYAEVDFFRVLPAVRLQEGPAGRPAHRHRRGRHRARDARQGLLPVPPAASRPASAAAGLARIANAVQAALAERQICRRDLDARQPAHRRDALLAQPAARHDAAAVRQLGAARARHDQQ